MQNRLRLPADTFAVARRAFDRHAALHTLNHYTGILSLQGLARLAVTSGDAGVLAEARRLLLPFAAGEVSFRGNFPNYFVGGNGAALLVWKGHLPEARERCQMEAERILKESPRDPAGLIRMPGENADLVWIDAAFAVVPFLLFSGLAFDRPDYVDDACHQIGGMADLFRDPANGLLHQSRGFIGRGLISHDHWSRGNGWGLLAMAEVVAWLPADHPQRPAAERQLVDLLAACLRYQDDEGVWHQEITEPDTSYAETSGTGLILFALGVAIEKNLLDAAARTALSRGLRGYTNYIAADGSVTHTCTGCLSPGDGSIERYKQVPHALDDPHAFGPVTLAFGQAHKLGIHTINPDAA